jgi:hypothetical protein
MRHYNESCIYYCYLICKAGMVLECIEALSAQNHKMSPVVYYVYYCLSAYV